MILEYDEVEYELPDDLTEITIEQYQDWMTTYGTTIQNWQDYIDSLEDGDVKAMEQALLFVDRMQKAVSFFSTIPLNEVVNSVPIQDVGYAYIGSGILPAVEFQDVTAVDSYLFSGETYFVRTPVSSVSEPITQDEFVCNCRLGNYLREIYRNNAWTNAVPVLAGYLRLEAEDISSSLIDPAEERVILFKDLPLSIAFPVIQNLNATMSQFTTVIDQTLDEELNEES